MSPITILERIRHLFAPERNKHPDSISGVFPSGTLREPGQPMSDLELARAIRALRAVPASDWTIAKLSRRLSAASGRGDI